MLNWVVTRKNKEKSKQNITRDIEVKNNLTIARGEWGEGFSETTIEDTWTKHKGGVEVGEGCGTGWGGVEGRGENADNCNWTTIKNKNK